MNQESELTVAIDDLRAVATLLFDHLEAVRGPEVRLDMDYFWSVPPERKYDSYEQPTELALGQLSESWDNLQRIQRDPDLAISFALSWLASVLAAIGTTVVE